MGFKNTAPCRNCHRRTVTCHGVCKEYQEFRKEQERINAERYAEQETYVRNKKSEREYWRKMKR